MNDHTVITKELSRNLNVFKELLRDIDKNQFMWKADPDKWCLLEMICHLDDEEREDFRARTRHVLENPNLPLPSIDPVGWVSQRNYLNQDFEIRLRAFLEERKKSIEWLNSLTSPNWDNVYSHPTLGEMSARMFLTNWLAHDYLHIRQITRLKYDYLNHISGESLNYAGKWV